jgi:hypothetical protein
MEVTNLLVFHGRSLMVVQNVVLGFDARAYNPISLVSLLLFSLLFRYKKLNNKNAGGLQVGGGVNLENAKLFLSAGASHVIVTSVGINYLFHLLSVS